ncbi:tRNase Z endonuclease, partial [Rhizoctonia solani]
MPSKTRASANSNMRWHIRVVSGLTSDTEPCISVHFDTAHYLFNCGEGTTRSFIQQRYGIKKSKAIFLTQMKVSRLGGLTGMLMSLADAGVTGVDVLGPPGLNHFLASVRSYVFRDWMRANTTEITQAQGLEKIYEDTFIRVYAFSMSPQISEGISIPVKRKASGGSLRSSSPKRPVRDNSDGGSERSRPQHSRNTSTLKGVEADEWRATIIRDMFPGRSGQNQAPVTLNKESSPPGISRASRPRRSLNRLPVFEGSTSTSVAYLVLGPKIRGKFDPTAADALGVPKRERGKLTKGESVTVTVNGVQNIITPDMCMGESEAPTGFLIIDCPNKDYIPSLPDPKTFHPIQSETPFVLSSIYHRAGPGILSDPRYRSWVETVAPPECNHLVASEDFSPNSISFQSSAHLSLVLSELDKDMFFAPRENDSKDEIAKLNNVFQNPYILCPGFVTEMTPPKPPVLKLFPGVKNNLYKEHTATHARGESLLSTDDERDSFNKARQQISDLMSSHTHDPAPGDDFRVTTLGTGSALPSKYRNVISTVIQMPNYGSIILDCGENTWGQMCRRFGIDETAPENAYSVLADVKCIFVSHIHGDHHMGLLKLLTTRRALTPAPKDPLYLILNRASELCVREYHDLEDIGLGVENGVRIVQIEKHKSRCSRESNSRPISTKLEEITGLLGFDSIEAVPVRHRTNSCFGIVARHNNGWSFAYSGDTMPCDTLTEAGKNVTLLIHEASMADEEWEKAAEKGHSTIGQAMEMGTRMNAKYLLLTHFSQRYPKIPVIKSRFTATALAFDYMTISTPHFWKVGSYMGALEKVFESELTADDDIAMD